MLYSVKERVYDRGLEFNWFGNWCSVSFSLSSICSLGIWTTVWARPRAPSAKEGLWKIAAIRPVIVFLGGSYPERTVECCSDHPLPSLELVTHKTHKCRQTGAYRTLNKRGHIPYVFPHEVTSCSRGRMGCWESTGDRLRRTLPLPKDLSALFMFFFSLSLCLHYLHLSIHLYLPLFFPALLIPPIGIARLDVKLWCNIYWTVKPYRRKCRNVDIQTGISVNDRLKT